MIAILSQRSAKSDGATRGAATPALSSVDQLRVRGMAAIVGLAWGATGLIALTASFGEVASLSIVLLLGGLINALPTWLVFQGRHDAAARAIVGTLAASVPALLVYALQGHGWQMDAHMYFFVGLAALAVLCDWRPIVIASALIALHHAVLDMIAPGLVFNGTGAFGRVLFHALAVMLQCAVLSFITIRLAALLSSQEDALAEARTERRRSSEALTLAQETDIASAAERARHRAAEQASEAARRQQLLSLADGFEQSVAAIAVAIDGASGQLESSAIYLDDMAGNAKNEASDVEQSAGRASTEIRQVADAIRNLSLSITSIAGAADQQTAATVLAREDGRRSAHTVGTLVDRAEQIEHLLEEIRVIARKTNLLALNATIEAARAGEASRGFAVVASEVKSLALDTAQASERISHILTDVRRCAAASSSDAQSAMTAVQDVSDAAAAISSEVSEQRQLALSIEQSAACAADGALTIEHRIGRVTTAITAAVTLSSEVRVSASALSSSVRELRRSTDQFVQHLRQEKIAA